MIKIAEIAIGLSCFAVVFVLYSWILPKMKNVHQWHIQGANVLGLFAIYLGWEVMLPSSLIDQYYWGYLAGNALFPLGCVMIAFNYWRQGRRKIK
jgi:hypothetical protein